MKARPAIGGRAACQGRGAVASEGLPGFMSENVRFVWGPPARIQLRRPNSAAAPDGASARGKGPGRIFPLRSGLSRGLVGPANSRILTTMDAVYLVLASNSGRTELWAATGSAGKALAQVRDHLPSGWMLTLSGECLLPEAAASLGIVPGEVQYLSGDLLHPSLKLAFRTSPRSLHNQLIPRRNSSYCAMSR